MKNRVMFIIVAASFVAASCSMAASTFTDASGNHDVHDANNWDNGLPTGTKAIIGSSRTAVATNDFTFNALDLGANGDTGTVTVAAGTFYNSSYSSTIGNGTGGYGILNVSAGAQFLSKGGTTELYAGQNGSYAELNIAGSLSVIKYMELSNAVLNVESTAENMGNCKDYMAFGGQSETKFTIDADGTFNGTLNFDVGNEAPLYIDSNADLDIVLEGSPELGDSWTLISGYGSRDNQFAQGVNFIGSGGDEFDIAYDTGAESYDIVATYIPEPGVLGLMGLCGILVLLRRKLRSN